MTDEMRLIERFRGCLLGLAAGDALGTTVEFSRRGTFPPVTDMVGGGIFNLSPGQWTDDTSMALCLAESLLERNRFDPQDQMDRYSRWRDHGHWSSTGRCFDIGNTVAAALDRYVRSGDPLAGSADPASSGNGCIMRLAPVPMFFFPDERAATWYSGESSRTTHGAVECIDACRLFGGMIARALSGASTQAVLRADADEYHRSPRIAALARGDYVSLPEHAIKGTGYVVDSLQAALWCFVRSESFEEAVLRAVNLGDDADTTGAVCGQLAGAFYGERGIPAHWRARTARHDEIAAMAERLCRNPA